MKGKRKIPEEVAGYINRLGADDRQYFFALYKKYWQKEKPLKIGKNFIPSACLEVSQRYKDLGAVDYSLIEKEPGLANFAANVNLICNPMDGGIGSSLIRFKYLKKIWKEIKREGKPRLGAKGVDLFFDFANQKVSITELKYLQVIKESRFYNKIIIEELVNNESKDSINHFLDKTLNFWARSGKNSKKAGLSYRQLIEKEKRICFSDEMVIQPSLPTIDKENNCLTLQRTAPGGHGQLGYIALKRAAEMEPDLAKNSVRAIYNGDGPNNFPDKTMVGFMVKNKIPIVMISSTKTPIDKKGGQIGLELCKGGKKRVQILESAQAQEQGQGDLFEKIGLEGADSSSGEPNKQFFNTNMALLNCEVLSSFLRDLSEAIGEEKFSEVISPTLIRNEKRENDKTYVQLEGALASALLNLSGFLKTTEDRRVKNLLKKHSIVNFLTIINIDKNLRTNFFTPVKFAWDFWLYAFSGRFRFNSRTYKLKNLKPGKLPGFDLGPFYRDLENCVNAFGRASAVELDYLAIEGKVLLKDAILSGRVKIKNELEGLVDLNQEAFRSYFKQRKGRLFLKDIEVIIKPGRVIKLGKLI